MKAWEKEKRPQSLVVKCLNIKWQAKMNSGKWILEVTCPNGKRKF
jgi:hypothetical protein